MTESTTRLVEVVRQVIIGFDEIAADLRRLGVNPLKLEQVAESLRDVEYQLLAEVVSPTAGAAADPH